MRISTTKFQNAFGKFLKHAMANQDVTITKNGKAVAKLVAYQEPEIPMVSESTADYFIHKYVTLEEFLKISEQSEGRFELIDGQLHLLASPGHHHQFILQHVNFQMLKYFEHHKCQVYTSPYDVTLYLESESNSDEVNMVQPDLLVICDSDQVNDQDRYEGIPSLVVEIISPSTRSKDMLTKLNLYIKSGISEYWIIDPEHEVSYIYYAENKEIHSIQNIPFDETITSRLFNGLQVSLR